MKAISIKGKNYIEVNERIKYFREHYQDWALESEIVSLNAGVCVIKATVRNPEGIVKATGYAYETENSTFINKTSYIENCVPLTTQILTFDGWKYFYQLKENELVFSYNMQTCKNEYCKLLKVNICENRPLVNLSTSRFNVTCTDAHKWLVRSQYEELHKEETKELKSYQKIVQAIKQDYDESIIGQKLGWLMCDCEIKYNKGLPSTAYITQSKESQINVLNSLFGKGIKNKTQNDNWKQSYEWRIPQKDVLEILGHFNIQTYKDLSKAMLKADINDVAGCFKSMMLADGESRGFSSTYIELVEAIQIMAIRLGIATTFITSRECEKSTKSIYTIGIKKTDGACVSEFEKKIIPPKTVWCPTTENGTWFMKEDNFVTLTSNCETSAWGRALGNLGIGIDTSIASAEEVLNAQLNQKKPTLKTSKSDPVKELFPEDDDMLIDSDTDIITGLSGIADTKNLEIYYKQNNSKVKDKQAFINACASRKEAILNGKQ